MHMMSRLIKKSFRQLREAERVLAYRSIYRKFKDFTMIPESTYIKNLLIAHRALNQEGCIVECGVWRGGMIAGIADLLGASRKYYLFDSFEGLPPAKPIDGEAALAWQSNENSPLYHDNNSAKREFAEKAMAMSAATNFEIVKGWFEKTLPQFTPSAQIAVLRLDADWFDSTLVCLECLSPYMAKKGIIILDDYYTWDGCSKAVHYFLSRNESSMKICRLYGEICVLHNSILLTE